MFLVFLDIENFLANLIFFRFFWVFLGRFFGTGVYRRLVGELFHQALPDLWSPRVWFTFRKSKWREILKINGV